VPKLVTFATSIAELAHAEKSCTQSLNQSASLFDAPGTEALAHWKIAQQPMTHKNQ